MTGAVTKAFVKSDSTRIQGHDCKAEKDMRWWDISKDHITSLMILIAILSMDGLG